MYNHYPSPGLSAVGVFLGCSFQELALSCNSIYCSLPIAGRQRYSSDRSSDKVCPSCHDTGQLDSLPSFASALGKEHTLLLLKENTAEVTALLQCGNGMENHFSFTWPTRNTRVKRLLSKGTKVSRITLHESSIIEQKVPFLSYLHLQILQGKKQQFPVSPPLQDFKHQHKHLTTTWLQAEKSRGRIGHILLKASLAEYIFYPLYETAS